MQTAAIAVIERALASGVLTKALVVVPSRGATIDELDAEQERLGRGLSDPHRALLQRWNGVDLDVLRLYGAGRTEPGIRSLFDEQRDWPELRGDLVIGSDPSGVIYLEAPTGEIWTFETDGGAETVVAASVDALFTGYVFGGDATAFGGEKWAEDLRRAGLAAQP